MTRNKAKALPSKMITVYAEILQETEKAILARCDEAAATLAPAENNAPAEPEAKPQEAA